MNPKMELLRSLWVVRTFSFAWAHGLLGLEASGGLGLRLLGLYRVLGF